MTDVKQLEDSSEKELARLDRNDRSLWFLTATLIVNLAVVVLALYFGGLTVESPVRLPAGSERDIAVSLGGLVLIFVLFLSWKQQKATDLRRYFLKERLRNEVLRARLAELTSLFDAAVRIRAPLALEPALDTIADRVIGSLACDGSAILLTNSETQTTVAAALAGSPEGRRPLEALGRNEIALAEASQTKEPIIWTGDELWRRIGGSPNGDGEAPMPASLLLVPLRCPDREIGSLALLRFESRPPFSPDERIYFADFGHQLAAVIDRIEQFAVLQRKNRILEDTNQRLLDLNRLKRLVLSTVNHEVRTPLSAIISYSELLLQDGDSLPQQTVREYQEIIGSKAITLVEFVNELADLLSLEADRDQIHFYPAAVDAIVSDAYLAQAPAAQRRGVRIEKEVDDDLPEVHIDLGRLSRAFRYLLSNSVRFAEDGGRILVQGRAENHPELGERVVISIWDNGVGARAGELAKVLSPSQVMHRRDMHRVEALGLGYYLVREIVELHGGEVWTEREDGRSALHLALPTERFFLSTHPEGAQAPDAPDGPEAARAA